MNKPKPRAKTEVPPPTTEEPKQEKTDADMEGDDQEPKVTEMDVGEYLHAECESRMVD
jgi:hypothetical protein